MNSQFNCIKAIELACSAYVCGFIVDMVHLVYAGQPIIHRSTLCELELSLWPAVHRFPGRDFFVCDPEIWFNWELWMCVMVAHCHGYGFGESERERERKRPRIVATTYLQSLGLHTSTMRPANNNNNKLMGWQCVREYFEKSHYNSNYIGNDVCVTLFPCRRQWLTPTDWVGAILDEIWFVTFSTRQFSIKLPRQSSSGSSGTGALKFYAQINIDEWQKPNQRI